MQTRWTTNRWLLSRMEITPHIATVMALCSLLLTWTPAHADSGAAGKAATRSVYTELRGKSCTKTADPSDPNDTPYLVCAGASGYALILRRVDAGRVSIDVVDPQQRAFPLDYQEVVTRHMFSLGSKAEWRVATIDGKNVPIAVIVAVLAHESDSGPSKVTNTYFAVAKITAESACVTDRIAGAAGRTAARNAADTAQGRNCLPPQPHMTKDDVIVR